MGLRLLYGARCSIEIYLLTLDDAIGGSLRQTVTLDDAIGSHACSFEASKCATNVNPLGCLLFLPIGTVNHFATLKAHVPGLQP
jgi:hypothetical protein